MTLSKELLSFRRTPFVNDWSSTLARITSLENLADAVRGLTNAVIANITKNPDDSYDQFIDGTNSRLAGLETLASSIMGLTSSIAGNIDKSDLA